MYFCCFLLLLAFRGALCQDCVIEDFEDRLPSSSYGDCSKYPMWSSSWYSSELASPHPESTRFATPRAATTTCMTSDKFTMTGGGRVEVTGYMMPRHWSDGVWIYVYEGDCSLTGVFFGPSQSDFCPGWQTVRIDVPGSATFEGYLMFFGLASPASDVLIDSFRYVGPSCDTDWCVIYKKYQHCNKHHHGGAKYSNYYSYHHHNIHFNNATVAMPSTTFQNNV